MSTLSVYRLKQWLKNGESPLATTLFHIAKAIRHFELPTPQILNKLFYGLHKTIITQWQAFTHLVFYVPAFKGRLNSYGKRTLLYGGLPFFSGPLTMSIGNDCRISGQTTFSGRTNSANPTLTVGNNVDICWQTTIAVGNKVVIGDNVRIAGQGFLCGYPGHPIDPIERARGKADLDSQVGDIILEKDVWLGSRVSIIGNVTVGEGTIVASGSVVTKSLPPFVLAGGNPAKVIKPLDISSSITTSSTNKEEVNYEA
ncbi:acyltransferase [Aliivibrio sp. S4TY2]|uniref:acyltransferase n=1 Tax=unclassified Aliivibrio TaxID=2645654 RepID=UPI0023783097|nr:MULTISPECIES: acyltransferase [unclassified Aliivibrio]MDD9155117.1 acyltransferase [Aliivibrio sp. S4TY2]MDD9159331.1 acyltransferase [Aliivibrio sp. S4TY1]MDD9163119.1 acyltransferase [Aliivibrio sp. S4MY2]MDD9167330.1 acyltransferase [Aliivibrio sp. S4MY4]MDD9184196.1 acyltransferase [Aliivibrio sp. S4MY3]